MTDVIEMDSDCTEPGRGRKAPEILYSASWGIL